MLISLCSSSQTLGLALLNDTFAQITDIGHPPGDARLFIAEQTGHIRILNPNQTANVTPFLTIPPTLLAIGGEAGLLGLAFHPDYATNNYFYVYYTNPAGDGIIVRYIGGVNVAVPTATIVMTIPQAFGDYHKGGGLRFGNDGYLYIAIGDNYTTANAQDIDNYMGKILRIDVNSSTVQTPHYGIPPGNPFVGVSGLDEIWAIGLRNPWRISIDANDQLWVADVGQNYNEEINKVSATIPGVNYGWSCYEANVQYNTTCPVDVDTLTFPVASYQHLGEWCAVIGGNVYGGSANPSFTGKYFFGDGCSNRIGWLDAANSINWSEPFANFEGTYSTCLDNNGEIIIASWGSVYRLFDASLGTASFAKTSFQLHPNPATSKVHLKATGISFPATVNLFDISGKLLCKQSLESESNAIAISQLQSGIYLVSLTDSVGATANSKLVIE